MPKAPWLIVLFAIASAWGVSSGQAFAQVDTSAPLDRIAVVETRQAYRGEFGPMETPQAEQILDLEVLENAGALDLVTALDLSASVSRQNNFGGLWNAFALRGFAGDGNLPSNYLINGFNAGRGFSGPRDISGIESIEVLKGPKAALFGRGEPGGTVNIVTKRPTPEAAGLLRVSHGRFNQFRVDGDYNTPLSENAAIRLLGFWEDAESFRDTIETERYGFTPSLAIAFSPSTRFVYELEYAHQEIPFDRGIVALDGRPATIPRSTFLGEPGDGPLKGKVFGHQLELQQDINDRWSALIGLNHRDTSLSGFSTEPELAGGRQLLFVDGETLSRQRRFRDYDATFKALRGEIAGEFETAGLRHRILIGGDYDEFVNDQVFERYRPPSLATAPSLLESNAIDIFEPVYGQFPLPDVGPLTDRLETQEAFGFYIQDQITLTERLDLRLGVRFDDFRQKSENRRSGAVFEQSSSRFSPQAGIVYSVADALSLYAAYGEGFRQLSGTDVDGNGFKPNTTESFEAGMKFELNNGRLLGTAAFFRIDQENILVGDPDNPFSLLAIGEARSEGFELDVMGALTEQLSVLLSYAFVDAVTQNDVLDPDFNRSIEAGDRLINIPKHTLSAQLVMETTALERPLRFGGGVLHVGERRGETATDFRLPAYTTARLFAEYSPLERITVRASIDNLFGDTYFTNSFASLWVQPGAPRTWRLSADYAF